MLKRISILFILSVLFSCAPTIVKTELDQLFEKNFESLKIPEVTMIKSKGINKSFPYVTFDKVWDSTMKVLIQQGIIVRASKDTGVVIAITTPPLAMFVERGEVITVHLNWMEDLYKRLDKPELVTAVFMPDDKEKMAKTFFDKLATQVYAEEKWKYLYKTEQ